MNILPRLRALLHRLLGLFRTRSRETEMEEELRAHLDGLIERNLAAGMPPTEARDAALRAFGGVEQIKERSRDRWRVLWIEHILRDAGFAVRTLRKSPGFTAVVVFTLALGLGVNTAVFTWFNAAAFRPLPVLDPGQLFRIDRIDPQGRNAKLTYADFVAYRDHQTSLAGLAAVAGHSVTLVDEETAPSPGGAPPAAVKIEAVSGSYFSTFGVPMALGRPLAPSDESGSSAQPVIVLSHLFWQTHFNGDPAVLGQTLRVRGFTAEPLTIIGVAGPEFFGTKPGALAGWVPLLLRPGEEWRSGPKAVPLALTARLRPGLPREQAAEDLQVITNDLLVRPAAGTAKAESVALTRASTYITLGAKDLTILLPMLCMFGAVFIISCANASNLILARMVTRQFELAVRSALGASRWRLFVLLMSESLVLGLLGGVVGWLLSAALLRFVWPWVIDMMPGLSDGTAGLQLSADVRVLAFTVLVSVLAGAAGGLLPALHVMRRNLLPSLNREGSAFGRRLRLSRVRSLLAVAQLALSSALLFTAGLLVHRVLRTQFQDVGFDKSRLVTLEVLAPRAFDAPKLDAARQQVLARIRALPEIAAVSETRRFPFQAPTIPFTLPAPDAAASARNVHAVYAVVPADYFTTLQLPLTRGRAFLADETPAQRTIIVSETAARIYWPAGDALGQRIEMPTHLLPGSPAPAAPLAKEASPPRTALTVVGIARDTRVYDPLIGDRPVIYMPQESRPDSAAYLLLRTTGPVAASLAQLQQIGREATGFAPRVITVDEVFAGNFVMHRILAWVGGLLALIALLVAVIGLYGVMSFTVNQRVKELGIRIALGATPRRITASILRQSLVLVACGALAGYGLSVAITVVARRLLSNLSAFNPLACLAVALLLAIIGVVACWIPARRAARVDPIVALRTE